MAKSKIKCPFCNGVAETHKEDTKLFGGRVVLTDDEFYRCEKCGEEFSTSEQVKKGEKRLKEFFFQRQIIRTGRSLAITIPTDLTKFYNLHTGEKVKIIPESQTSVRIEFE